MSNKTSLVCEQILGFSVAASSFNDQINLIMQWGQQRLGRMVCVANVHMLMEARWSPTFARVLWGADMLTPDGMPLVWTLNMLRKSAHDRVAGMYILREVCQRASATGMGVYFLGTDDDTLAGMRQRLNQEFPDLVIAGMEPLPFRPLTPEEDRHIVQAINESQAGVVFVALGCPKQEIWMHQHRHRIHAVMVGIGGVFPIYAGIKKHAPQWIQDSGLEWFYRLSQEPGRLWKRYFRTIPPFVYLSAKQVVTTRVHRRLNRMLASRMG
ncbi:WecB/TagA/CpsF family glycosyltransferase [Nodosilinea nodulosa]|uniref:WecB/TagA/CpsF family glycosyltransferase n=1 Tax=Nodosilinea nodulosa TaxID=416001 RepID=UPI0003022B88|nr:WecB/TagA/CpsF family glycosyltransferase [Nodosilinea nodulosa]